VFKAADTTLSPIPVFADEDQQRPVRTSWPEAKTQIAGMDSHAGAAGRWNEHEPATHLFPHEQSNSLFDREQSDPGVWGAPMDPEVASADLAARLERAGARRRQDDFDSAGIALARREAERAEEAARLEAIAAAENMELEAFLAAQCSIIDEMLTAPVSNDERPGPVSGEFRAIAPAIPDIADEPSVQLPPGSFVRATPAPMSMPAPMPMPVAFAPGMQPMPQPPRRMPMDSTPPDDELEASPGSVPWFVQGEAPQGAPLPKREAFPSGLPQTIMTIPPTAARRELSEESLDCRPPGLLRWIANKVKR